MIILINNQNRHLYSDLIDDMFKVRADVFHKRLNWDVIVRDDREIDIFDSLDPTYVVSVCDEAGAFQGSVRLLPTTGPNMLRDVFPTLLNGGPNIEGNGIWESSRFSIKADQPFNNCAKSAARFTHRTTIELLLGIIEFAQENGIDQIVSVFDARMKRLFRRIGCTSTAVGVPAQIGRVMTHAGMFETTDALWNALARTTDITDFVVRSPIHADAPKMPAGVLMNSLAASDMSAYLS